MIVSVIFCVCKEKNKRNDELKNIAQVEHSRPRCFETFVVNMLGAIAAYCFFPKKICIYVGREFDNRLTLKFIELTLFKKKQAVHFCTACFYFETIIFVFSKSDVISTSDCSISQETLLAPQVLPSTLLQLLSV